MTTPLSPDTLQALRSRLGFRVLVGTVFGVLVAGLAALVGLVVDAFGPTVPALLPIGFGVLAALFYVFAARSAPLPAATAVDAADDDSTSPPAAPAGQATPSVLAPVPGDVARMLASRQIRVLGDDAVRLVIAPGQRIGLLAAARCTEHPDAPAELGRVVAQVVEQAQLPIRGILVDLDGAAAPTAVDGVTVTSKAKLASACTKLPKVTVAQLMSLAAAQQAAKAG